MTRLIQPIQLDDTGNFEEIAVPTSWLDRFLAENHPTTLFVVLDLNVVRARYTALRQALPAAATYYAESASRPGDRHRVGSTRRSFRSGEPRRNGCLLWFGYSVGTAPLWQYDQTRERCAQASSDGIELFAFDSAAELENLARSASGARVFCRMLIANKGAEWPLTRKFGCEAHASVAAVLFNGFPPIHSYFV
jgi:ornithine decarboxylase